MSISQQVDTLRSNLLLVEKVFGEKYGEFEAETSCGNRDAALRFNRFGIEVSSPLVGKWTSLREASMEQLIDAAYFLPELEKRLEAEATGLPKKLDEAIRTVRKVMGGEP